MTSSVNSTPRWRTLLVLGRVSNVPTVWSNCLAAWLLGGGGSSQSFAILILGATLIYVGGMYWNDAFDVDFDRQYRPERPIPSGAITEREVWWLGGGMLGGGLILISTLGTLAAQLGLLLVGMVILYDVFHKRTIFSPIIMAACRFFLFLAAGAASSGGLNGWTIWGATVLAAYIVGLSFIAKVESDAGPLGYWPMYLLAAPLVLTYFVNDGRYRTAGLVLAGLVGLWIFRCLRFVITVRPPQFGRAVSGLLAGICLTDLLLAGMISPAACAALLGLFLLSNLFQRFVPAT